MSNLERSDVDAQPTFDRTEQLIRAKGREIVDMSRDRRFIETKNAFYSIVEGPTWEIALVYAQCTASITREKNFPIHGPHLSPSTSPRSKAWGSGRWHARSERLRVSRARKCKISRNVDDFEIPS